MSLGRDKKDVYYLSILVCHDLMLMNNCDSTWRNFSSADVGMLLLSMWWYDGNSHISFSSAAWCCPWFLVNCPADVVDAFSLSLFRLFVVDESATQERQSFAATEEEILLLAEVNRYIEDDGRDKINNASSMSIPECKCAMVASFRYERYLRNTRIMCLGHTYLLIFT